MTHTHTPRGARQHIIVSKPHNYSTSTHRRQPRDQESTRSSMVQSEGTSQSSGARYGAVACRSASSCSSAGLQVSGCNAIACAPPSWL